MRRRCERIFGVALNVFTVRDGLLPVVDLSRIAGLRFLLRGLRELQRLRRGLLHRVRSFFRHGVLQFRVRILKVVGGGAYTRHSKQSDGG